MSEQAQEIEQAKIRWREKVDSFGYQSKFKHLSLINGWRKGELHTFIAGKGEGKSTLIRAWILEMLANKKKVYVRLSEEPAQDFRDSLLMFMGRESAYLADNLLIDSEMDFHDESQIDIDYKNIRKGYLEDLDYKIKEFGADYFIYDNFTTGIMSRKKFLEERLAIELRTLAHINQIPVIVAAHTSKGFKKLSFATGDDIRGNMMLSNTAAYIITLTTFWDLSEPIAVLFWDKARHHSAANKKLFQLHFCKNLKTYISDTTLPMDEYFKKRQTSFSNNKKAQR
jgi:hypothetical protein